MLISNEAEQLLRLPHLQHLQRRNIAEARVGRCKPCQRLHRVVAEKIENLVPAFTRCCCLTHRRFSLIACNSDQTLFMCSFMACRTDVSIVKSSRFMKSSISAFQARLSIICFISFSVRSVLLIPAPVVLGIPAVEFGRTKKRFR